jgi:DNA-binding CsgD family transcriptional regulator
VVVNTLLFGAMAIVSIRHRHREQSQRMRTLWLIVALLSMVFVVGSVQRVLVQASLMGWISQSVSDFADSNWQIVQSLIVACLTIAAFVAVRGLASSFALSEDVAQSVLVRVGHVQIEELDLSPRELEVLEAIGSGLVTDVELSEALHISRSTVQTHVKHLLKKTNLESRNDLVAVAHLMSRRGQ